MWSASSSTVISMPPRSAWPDCRWSASRPGQAMTMSTPLRSALDLRVGAHPAEDRQRAQAERARQRGHRGLDLAGQLPGGGEHEGARAARAALAAAGREPREQRQHEGVGLAGAGAAAAEHVAPGQRVGQRRGLDRERGGDAGVGERRDEGRGHAEVGEGTGGVRHGEVLLKKRWVVLPGATWARGAGRGARWMTDAWPEAELMGPAVATVPVRRHPGRTGTLRRGVRSTTSGSLASSHEAAVAAARPARDAAAGARRAPHRGAGRSTCRAAPGCGWSRSRRTPWCSTSSRCCSCCWPGPAAAASGGVRRGCSRCCRCSGSRCTPTGPAGRSSADPAPRRPPPPGRSR